ncbi:POU domain class 2-associating factor 1 [Clupea harengus]|uniref:POU domain class 2-associating factor 1 n=1 Tax=Clupea harengus TaxID=7950 RepID=A0A6P8GX76_CLUHA|nr:POU domain class 2-associating factor 1 [Clupea harengus]
MLLRNLPAEPSNSKPYQGVRVKDPVKELLRRKRGSSNPHSATSPPTAVVFPNSILPSYNIGTSGFLEGSPGGGYDMVTDAGALYTGWLAQPTAPTLQPVSHWPPPDYFHTDTTPVPAFSADMYVQPVCPSYTMVAPSSLLTLTHTPLFTNIGTITSTPAALPQVDFHDTSLAYIPWPQPLTTIPGPVMQYPPCSTALPTSPVPPEPPGPSEHVTVPMPEPDQQQMEEEPNPLEKLLEDDPKDSYVCSPSVFTQDV